MGRRTSGQQVGLQTIGNVQANASTLTTTQNNQDLFLDPNGVGGVIVNSDLTIADQGDLRLRESSGNGTNFLAMQAAASMASNYTITWPAAVAGTSGFVLSSDTSGNLSWVAQTTAGVSSADSGASATVHYPFFGTSGGSIPTGQLTAVNVRANLTFTPSTGELFSDIARHPNIIGSTANSGTITIRGTSAGAKAGASVLMTDGVASTTTATGTLVVTGGVGVSGQVTCNALSAVSITETSSITLKENIRPLGNVLDDLVKLVGYVYDRKDGSYTNEPGLIAEEVNEVFPELVSKDENGKPFGVRYSKLTAYLMEAIKEIKKEIDELKQNK